MTDPTRHDPADRRSAAARGERRGRRFFPAMAAALLLIVLLGFSPTFYLRARFDGPAVPGYLALHGAVLTAWFAWFLLQATLPAAGRVALHRLSGIFGALLGALVVIAGLAAALNYAPRMRALYGAGAEALERIPLVTWGNFGMLLSFGALLAAGLALRRRAGWHRRLMLVASISLMGPAFARIGRFPVFDGISEVPFIVVGTGLAFALLALHDVRTAGRLHPATVAGCAVFSLCLAAGIAAGSSAAGRDWILSAR